MPKKKFIDKKNSVTFHLVHRSQQDPLTADETAPQHVLVPAVSDKHDKKRFEEQQKYGIYFDDEYNYLQHLKVTANVAEWVAEEKQAPTEAPARLNLPSSVFASTVEEDVGLLNKAAPESGLRLDLDPDVVAAMDDDFNYEDPDNELEDNFMELANADRESGSEEDEDEDVEGCTGSDYSDEGMDEVGSLDGPQYNFRDEETRSRFTDYSMTSSVMRRNDQLTLLDNRFEKMYEGYDENEIGALDCDEIEGHIPETSDLLLMYAAEFDKQSKREKLDKSDAAFHDWLQRLETDSDGELVNVEVKPKEKWDCESILSTYSNIYNHPKLIKEPHKIRINPRTGMPVDDSGRLTARALSKLDEQNGGCGKPSGAESVISTLSMLSVRPKDESADERRERKRQLREYRRERRIERKANVEAFKEEAKRQNKININNRNNVQGNRIL